MQEVAFSGFRHPKRLPQQHPDLNQLRNFDERCWPSAQGEGVDLQLDLTGEVRIQNRRWRKTKTLPPETSPAGEVWRQLSSSSPRSWNWKLMLPETAPAEAGTRSDQPWKRARAFSSEA